MRLLEYVKTIFGRDNELVSALRVLSPEPIAVDEELYRIPHEPSIFQVGELGRSLEVGEPFANSCYVKIISEHSVRSGENFGLDETGMIVNHN
jgi:hypothetical protein